MKQKLAKPDYILRPHLRTGLDPEQSTLPSMTEPDQLAPLDKILTHRNKGIPVPHFNGVFSDIDTPDIQKMDFIEIAQLREQTTEGIEASKEDLHAINVEMEKRRLKAAEEAAKRKEEAQEKPPVSPSA